MILASIYLKNEDIVRDFGATCQLLEEQLVGLSSDISEAKDLSRRNHGEVEML